MAYRVVYEFDNIYLKQITQIANSIQIDLKKIKLKKDFNKNNSNNKLCGERKEKSQAKILRL